MGNIFSSIRDNFKHISSVLFLLILACNVVLFIVLLGIKSKLDEKIKISLEPTLELKDKIVKTFDRYAESAKSEIINDAKKKNATAIKTVTASVKELLKEQGVSVDKQLAAIAEAEKKNSAAIKTVTASVKELQKEQGVSADKQLAAIAEAEKKNSAAIEAVKTRLKEREINEQLVAIKKQIDAIGENTESAAKILTKINGEKSEKSVQYLKAARASVQNPEIAQILYVSALTYAGDKVPVLSEFIDWQTALIKQELGEGKVSLAQDRLVALVGICDANIASGSVRDMESVPGLKNKLKDAEELIKSRKDREISEQREKLEGFAQRVDDLPAYGDADDLLKELTAFTVDPSLNDRKDDIAAKIVAKQSCLTLATHPLVIPAINDNTPWCAWLRNFIARLKSDDLTVAEKLEDIGTAADFLQAAKKAQADGLPELLSEFEKVSRNVYLSYWQKRAERVVSSNDPGLNDASTLIAEYNEFKSEEQDGNKELFIKLNKCLVKATLSDSAKLLKDLKSLENSVSDESFMQMVGTAQGQYLQILLRVRALETKYTGEFSSELSDVTKKIAFLGELIGAYRKRLEIQSIRDNEDQRTAFVEWAKQTLALAKESDDAGEKIADAYFKTRSNPEAVANYKRAWQALIEIHPGDLQSADPALYQTYSELKAKIETHRTPTEAERSGVKYKRITDFKGSK